MEKTFNYSSPVSGLKFLGRKNDVTKLCSLLSQSENIAIWCPPKTGLTSLLQETVRKMRASQSELQVAFVSLRDVRSSREFLLRLGDAVCRAAASTAEQYADIVGSCLCGSHFVFDPKQFARNGRIISLGWDTDDEDTLAMLRMPYMLSAESGKRLIVVIEDFQNIDKMDDGFFLMKTLESVIKEAKSQEERAACSFVMCGSQVNAMKEIFLVRKMFYRLVECFEPSPLADNDIIEHVRSSLMSSGKVVETELLVEIIRIFRNNIWYLNHYMAICDHLSKGYIMEPIMKQALEMIVSIHEPKFNGYCASLTNFQLSFLKAIMEGQVQFSSAEIIEKYGLNSSANIKRVRDALIKKEIITFGEKEELVMLDPLFEYWVRKYFFKLPVAL